MPRPLVPLTSTPPHTLVPWVPPDFLQSHLEPLLQAKSGRAVSIWLLFCNQNSELFPCTRDPEKTNLGHSSHADVQEEHRKLRVNGMEFHWRVLENVLNCITVTVTYPYECTEKHSTVYFIYSLTYFYLGQGPILVPQAGSELSILLPWSFFQVLRLQEYTTTTTMSSKVCFK